jgi:hypothetical protein
MALAAAFEGKETLRGTMANHHSRAAKAVTSFQETRSVESGVYPKLVAPDLVELMGLFEPLLTLDDTAALSGGAARLCVRVLDHLADEERPDGLLVAIEENAPRLAPCIAALRREHDDLRTLASTAFGLAAQQSAASLQRAALDRLMRLLRAHSAREVAAFQEALLTDIGGESGTAEA